MAVKIDTIEALEILDSRGDPTVEVDVVLSDGSHAKAGVPSGASTGVYEAFELRDNDPHRFGGKGVSKAVRNVNTVIRNALIGLDPSDQQMIDRAMIQIDGTENKKELGANAILGVSLAVARAFANSEQMPLYRYIRYLSGSSSSDYVMPVPFINVINGGKHASSNLDIQEFWVIPFAEESFKERLRQGSEIFHALGMILKESSLDTDLGNEGGYAPDFSSNTKVFEFLLKAIDESSLTAGKDVSLGMDAGSSVFYDTASKEYNLELDSTRYTASEFIDFYMRLLDEYPILALEDPFAEEDWSSWQEFSMKAKTFHPHVRVIGDDLFVTNVSRLKKGIERGVANSILIKPNQIGTLTETLECIQLAQKNGYAIAVSHRSGETTDSFIADLAVGVNSEYIKTGSTARGERMVKYNRLLEIEHELGK